MRLTSTQQTSRPVEIHDGDLVQLGVDYQDGMEPCYRAVKMRFEVNRPARPATYNAAAFHNLKTLTNSTQVSEQHPTSMSEEDDCCICLYGLQPAQALFVAPCSHSFHFKCIRPLLASYPGFQCPMCRSYSDLRDNEAEDKLLLVKKSSNNNHFHHHVLRMLALLISIILMQWHHYPLLPLLHTCLVWIQQLIIMKVRIQ